MHQFSPSSIEPISIIVDWQPLSLSPWLVRDALPTGARRQCGNKSDSDEHEPGPVSVVLAVDHCDLMNSCPEDEPMTPSEECVDAATDESLLETNPIQSPLQVFAGMGGLALIAERLPMLYPDVMQQVGAQHRQEEQSVSAWFPHG